MGRRGDGEEMFGGSSCDLVDLFSVDVKDELRTSTKYHEPEEADV